jgi:hypothetical protein
MNIKDFWFKVAAVVLALISPFILISSGEILPSLSSYWMSDLQPLFIITNAVTSYYMFSANKWRIPSLFLLLLTAFSVEMFPTLHNIVAITFFVTNLYPLFSMKRLRWLTYIYLLTLPIFFFSILWGEIAAVIILAAHHGLVLYSYYKVQKIRKHRL